MKPSVLYEDNHLLIVNKNPGILAQGDKTGDSTILDIGKRYIKDKYDKPGAVFLGLVHRLDRPVSGCLILARTSKCLERMNRAFAEGRVEKQYLAITQNPPHHPVGRLQHYLVKDAAKNEVKVVSKPRSNSRKAELTYRLAAHISPYYLIEVQPQTGRSHQIRVQLSSIGCPIVGDRKYGGIPNKEDRSIALHCHTLRFEHPVKKICLTIQAFPPSTSIWKPFLGLLPLSFDSIQ